MLITYQEELTRKCKEHGIQDLCSWVIKTQKDFAEWSGSGNPEHHHYGDHGLIRHTKEVFDYAVAIYNTHTQMSVVPINLKELLVSVIWHDYGKIWDYQKVNGVWGKHNNHARQIHHISKSAMEFEKFYCYYASESARQLVNPDNVIHNILSHHGAREYGSPVAPATREAWILHLADNLSARLDDCDKHDIIKH